MPAQRIDGIRWYEDQAARDRGEPGLAHSYVASLATALRHADGSLDPVWLMGASAFAFRIFVNEIFCPSAMSVFRWERVLPEAVEQVGRRCVYVARMWEEEALEEKKRREAHAAIAEGVARGVAGVTWDVNDAEWGLIVGYDDDRGVYDTLTFEGEPGTLPYGRLGRNGIDVLSVAIPGEPNGRPREDGVRRSLEAAVAHAEGGEWMDRPKYQDGLAAFELWATLYDRWALITKAGKADRLSPELPSFARYYATVHYAARCYAREYLEMVGDGDERLESAAFAYAEVAAELRAVWRDSVHLEDGPPDGVRLSETAAGLRRAQTAEEAGLRSLRAFLQG